MSIHHFRLPLILTACLSLAACSSGGGGGGGGPGPFDPFATSWTSICQANADNGFLHFVFFDQSNSSFRANSARSFPFANCGGNAGSFGQNVLRGTFAIGNEVVTPGGFEATEVDFAYDPLINNNRTAVSPADFDLVHVDPVTNLIYLGAKTVALDGSSPATRPTAIDFNIVWTPN